MILRMEKDLLAVEFVIEWGYDNHGTKGILLDHDHDDCLWQQWDILKMIEVEENN
jgi:hypothetical protein